MNDDEFWTRLDRYLAGEATAAERAEIERWLAADPARRHLIEALREPSGTTWNANVAWLRMQARFESSASDRDPPAITAATTRRIPWLKAAAIAVLMTGAAAIWQLEKRDSNLSFPFSAMTDAGERDTLTLPDGSVAIMGPMSRIESRLAQGIREVKLTGEAFFDVVADPTQPFRVQAGVGVVEVLGTEFNVRALNDTASTVVAVREGRVLLRTSSAADSVVLAAGEAGRIDASGASVLGSEADRWLVWLDGDLQFDSAPLSDVITELERWFGQAVQLADPALRDRRVTGRFRAGSMEEVLEALTLTLGLQFERDSAVWTIRSRSNR